MKKKTKKWPHRRVYTHLLPSLIDPTKVGVFAWVPIKKGRNPFPGDSKMVLLDERKLRKLHLPDKIYALYEELGVLADRIRYSPEDLGAITNSWRVRHSKTPNLGYGENDLFYALRDIEEGEELTVDEDTVK